MGSTAEERHMEMNEMTGLPEVGEDKFFRVEHAQSGSWETRSWEFKVSLVQKATGEWITTDSYGYEHYGNLPGYEVGMQTTMYTEKVMTWWGLRKKDVTRDRVTYRYRPTEKYLGSRVIPGEKMTKAQVRAAAAQVWRNYLAEQEAHSLLGDYPPRSAL